MFLSKYIIEADSIDKKYGLLYNAKNNYMIRYPKKDFDLSKDIQEYPEIEEFLRQKKFFAEDNEQKEILKKQQSVYESEDVMMLIIKLTKQCNFRCIYCYENFSDQMLTIENGEKIIEFIIKEIDAHNFKTLIINWFGGEPLLNIELLKYLTEQVVAICDKKNVKYIGSITTNGYNLKPNIFQEMLCYQVNSFQITIDGCRDIHNRQRKYRNGKDTFDTIVQNLTEILNIEGEYSIVIRMNIDEDILKNISSIKEWIKPIFEKSDKVFLDFHPVVDFDTMDHAISDKKLLEIIKAFIMEGYRVVDLKNYISIDDSLCYAAKKNHYVIDSECKVSKCTVIENKDSYIGVIKAEGILERSKGYEIWNRRYHKIECENCVRMPFCNGGACSLYAKKYMKPRCNKFYGIEKELIQLIEMQSGYDVTIERVHNE